MYQVGSKAQKKHENRTHGRKQGTQKSEKLVLNASVVTKFPVSATKPSRGPCHLYAIFLLSSATVSSYLVVGDDFGSFIALICCLQFALLLLIYIHTTTLNTKYGIEYS